MIKTNVYFYIGAFAYFMQQLKLLFNDRLFKHVVMNEILCSTGSSLQHSNYVICLTVLSMNVKR